MSGPADSSFTALVADGLTLLAAVAESRVTDVTGKVLARLERARIAQATHLLAAVEHDRVDKVVARVQQQLSSQQAARALVERHRNHAREALVQRDYRAAFGHTQALLTLGQTDTWLYQVHAVASAMLGGFPQAADSLRRAVRTFAHHTTGDATCLSYYSDDARAAVSPTRIRHVSHSMQFLLARWSRLFKAAVRDDSFTQIASLVNLTDAALPGRRFADVPLYRQAAARILHEAVITCVASERAADTESWKVASTAVGNLGLLGASHEKLLPLVRLIIRSVTRQIAERKIEPPRLFATSLRSCSRLIRGRMHPTQ